MKRMVTITAAVVVVLGWKVARADVQVDLGIGYSHVTLNGSDRFEERDGVRIEPRVSFNPFDNVPALRLGFGLGVSGYSHQLDDETIIVIDHQGDVDHFHADQWETLTLLEPEFQLSWRQRIADHWYIEPGVGIGAAVGNYGIYDDWWWDNEHDSQWAAAFEVRPLIRAGYASEKWVIGGEVSYMIGGNIDLTDQVRGDLRELYVGGYFGYRW